MAEQDDKYRILADFLRQVGFRRGAMLFFAGGAILVLWKTDPIALIDRLSREKAETRVEAEQPVTKKETAPPYLEAPNGFVENKAAESAADGVSMANLQAVLGYKFVPSSNVYEYQGRLLIFAKTKHGVRNRAVLAADFERQRDRGKNPARAADYIALAA